MKKIGTIVSCVILAIGVFLFLASTQDAIGSSNREEKAFSQGRVAAEASVNDDSIKRARLTLALERFANGQITQTEPEEPPGVTREVAELHRKTEDHYFAMAPEILEEMLQEQRTNDHWSRQIEEAAQEALSYKESEGTSLSEVDCRERLCKLVFGHEDLGKHGSFMDGRMDEGPWMSGAARALGSYEVLEDGTIESFIYFTQPGDFDTFLNMRRRMALKLEGM